MHVSAKSEYAVRAMIELAACDDLRSADALAEAQGIPHKFLRAILNDLRRARLVRSQRGLDGGYRLARPADEISVADIIRAVEGQLADVRGMRPEELSYDGVAKPLQDVWIAARSALREVLAETSLADLCNGALPEAVRARAATPEAWA